MVFVALKKLRDFKTYSKFTTLVIFRDSEFLIHSGNESNKQKKTSTLP